MADIMISYPRSDSWTMRALRAELERAQLSVWVDEELEPGTSSWQQIIARQVETTFVMAPNPNWVTGSRVPDVMVYERARLIEYQAQQPEMGQLPLMLVPDLCIEVISQHDHYSEVLKKVRGYLQDGVRIVWLTDPAARTVAVFTHGSPQSTTLETDDMLDGGTVVPSFRIRVGDIFQAKI